MKKFFSYIILISIILSQSCLASPLPPIQMSAKKSFKELGRASAFYDMVINRRPVQEALHSYAFEQYTLAQKECEKDQQIYLSNLIGRPINFMSYADRHIPEVQEAINLFNQIKLYYEFKHLMKKCPDVYKKMLKMSDSPKEILILSNPDFIKNKFQ